MDTPNKETGPKMTSTVKDAVLKLMAVVEGVHYTTDATNVGIQYYMQTKGLIQHKGFGFDVNWEINSVPR